jgi:predicted ATPase
MRRAQIHHRIAERGVAIYGDQVCIIAAELAMHFEQSRDWPLALQYLSQAAENASRRSAHHEAADLATRGLAVIKLLPDSPQSAQQEISLRMTLGVSLMAMKGFAAPEVEEVYARARELFWLQGPSPQLFHMLWSLGLYYIFRGEIPSALELANQLLELASGLQDGPLIMEAHRAIGVTLVDLGRSSDALLHLNEAIKLYATHRNHRYAAFIGHDCKVVSECFAARALWALGYPDRAEERMAAALAHARDLGHPQTSVVAAHFLAQLHQLRGEVTLAHERAKEVVELADEYGLDLWLAFGNIDLGWAEAELGKAETGVDRMQSGLAAYETTGAKLWRPHFLGLLATALARVQKLEEALGVAAEATALAESSQEMYSLPELYRIRAQLLIMRAAAHYVDRSDRFPKSSTKKQAKQTNHAISSELVEANQYLAPALALAQRQQTKSWELRLLVTQNLLDAVQGLQEAHHSQLRDTYAWFTEGHGTMDLRHARIILESTSTDTKLVKA